MWFDGGELRAAMRAARSVLKNDAMQTTYTSPSCRLTNGTEGPRVWATDGYRVIVMTVREHRDGRSRPMSVALTRRTVRHICATRMPLVSVEWEGNHVAVDDGRLLTTRFPAGNGLDEVGLERALNQGPKETVLAEVARKPALEKLQKAGIRWRGICRIRISPDGVALWAGSDHPIGGGEPNARLCDGMVRKPGAPIVIGVRGSHLVDTLKALRSRKVGLEASQPDCPIHLGSDDGRDRATLPAARL